jgi:hypothetical protein
MLTGTSGTHRANDAQTSGGLYRYGPNQLSKFEDNIAVKLSFVLNFGL